MAAQVLSATSTSSVSKGCFLFKPAATSSKKKKLPSSLSGHGSFRKLPLESDKDVERRSRAYTNCWTQLRQRIDALTSCQNDKVFDDILKFISKSSQQLERLHQLTTESANPASPLETKLPPRLEVPTVALVAGVNMPDHDILFEQLRSSIRMDGLSPHVVLLKSKDCNSGIKATMKEILVQLMEEEKDLGNDDSDNDLGESQGSAAGGGASGSSSKKRLPLCSMDVLSSWYRESFEIMSRHVRSYSPAGTQVRHHPVVIIVEDFEGFIPRILQDLIQSLSPHLPEFPVVLVLGVATSVGAIHRTLARSASSLLCIEQFHAQHPTKTLSQIIAEVFVSSIPQVSFKLGPKALVYLLHQFYYCNFSLTDFARSLQFSMMEHFYWQPLSVLCDQSLGDLQLTKAHCEMIRATPSFQRYVEAQDPRDQIALLENDTKLKATVKKMITDLSNYHDHIFPLLECLHCLTRDLPNAPLGKKLHELYVIHLEQDLKENSKFQVAYSLLRMYGREEICLLARQCLGILSRARTYLESYLKPSSPALATVVSTAYAFERFLSDVDELDHKQDSAVPMDDGTSLNLGVQETTSERKMHFHERLRQLSSRNKAPSAFDQLKTYLLDDMIEVFETYLVSPTSYPLHEVFYFDQVTSLKTHLSPSPRASIQTAMSDPHFYLPSAGGVDDQSSLDSNMPDLCIAHQLHLECGRHINLYDWLRAYVSVVHTDEGEMESDGKEKKQRSSKEEVDPILHAQFIQSVSEMQFLGFIKPTQRKTDHVQRLTWGAC